MARARSLFATLPLSLAVTFSLLPTQVHAMTSSERAHAIRILRQAYAAFNRNDIPAAVANLDPDIDWNEPAEFPGGGAYRGRDAVAGYLSHSRAGWAEGASEPVKFITRGDRIVVFVHAKFRQHDSANWGEVSLADVYTFRNGIPVAMHAFADRSTALRWAGEPS